MRSDVTVPTIELSLGFVDLINMLSSPLAEREDRLAERPSQSGERIFYLGRTGRHDGARDEPVALQSPQGPRQHLLRKALDTSLDHVKSARSVLNIDDNHDAPLVSDAGQHATNAPVIYQHSPCFVSHLHMTKSQLSAFLKPSF